MTPVPSNRIIILGPKDDGTYVVEFRTADGEALAISIPRSEAHVIRHFQERMPYGLFVPEVRPATLRRGTGNITEHVERHYPRRSEPTHHALVKFSAGV